MAFTPSQKQQFRQNHIKELVSTFLDQDRYRDLALLCFSIDTMLRASDILALRAGEVMASDRRIVEGFALKQTKTGHAVEVALSPFTQQVVAQWIKVRELSEASFLFPSRFGPETALSASQFRRIIKGWASELGLNPDHYACHSLRRTKPAFMHDDLVSPATLRFLLGHRSLQSTQEYLGVDQQAALKLARQYDIFAFVEKSCS